MTEDELKSIFSIGELKGDVTHIKETLIMIESSMFRGGERMGRLEEGQSKCDKTMAVLTSEVNALGKDMDKLEKSKTWFITAIVGSYLAGITGKLWK